MIIEESAETNHTTPSKLVTPARVMPVPCITEFIEEKKCVRVGKAAVITSTPYKEQLESNIEKKLIYIWNKNENLMGRKAN